MGLYGQLLQNLRKGKESVLMTRCGPEGLTKNLLLDPLEAWSLPRVEEVSKVDNIGKVDKNEVEMVIREHFLPKPRLIILGGGHIAVPLAALGCMLCFEVTVFDDRPFFADRRRFPGAAVICEGFEKAVSQAAVRKGDSVVIVTRGHRYDQTCLRGVLGGEIPDYMGMIGSRRRVAIARRQMEEEGYDPEVVRLLHSPIGLPIGAVTPEEIALSIMAEIVQERRVGANQEACADLVLIEKLADAEAAMESGEAGGVAVVTVISTKGSTPREAGAKMAVFSDGSAVGSIGGGCAESDIMRDARDIGRDGGHRFKTVDLTDSAEEDGMVCGGTMKVLIEALMP
jgi:xanthine dehydrogenase accessory factor